MGIFDIFKKSSAANEKDDPDSLQERQKDMIRGIQELSETTVKEVMIPRIDAAFIDYDDGFSKGLESMVSTGHSRFPVFKDTIDNVVGMVYVKDVLKRIAKNDEPDFESIMRKPYFVPESKKLDSLLREMQRRHVHIAIAVDEYGGVSGIVCLEDIIEEIVGDIQDEFDNEADDIITLGPGTFLCDARLSIEDMNETIGSDIPDDDYDTLGGFVFELFGKIPVKFEKVSYNDIDFIIQEMDGQKIKSVKILCKEK